MHKILCKASIIIWFSLVSCPVLESGSLPAQNKYVPVEAHEINIGDSADGKGTLVWRDEFDEGYFDWTMWNLDPGAGGQYSSDLWGWGNNQKEWSKAENITVEDGKLIIEAKHDYPNSNFPYSSARITTAGIKEATGGGTLPPKDFLGVTTGYVEARIKTPRGTGFWPAFWLLGADANELSGYPFVSWPACGEIDILEMRGGQETTLFQTIHYGKSYPSMYWYNGETYTVPNMADDYHVYAVGWDSAGVKFYFDGELKNTIKFPLPQPNANTEAFYNDVPFAVIIDLAVGGNFLGGVIPSESAFSGPVEDRSLMVDWVRVYK